MLLMKAVFAGVAAAVIAAIGSAVAMLVFVLDISRNPPEGHTIGLDPVSLLRLSWLCGLILVGAFLLGLVSEYRRAR